MSNRKFLIPIDGSAASLRALDFAIQKQLQSKDDLVVLLHVQNLGSADAAGMSSQDSTYLHEAALSASAEALKLAESKCKQEGIKFQTQSRFGLQVAGAIVEAAREEKVEQIIMGTRGLSRVQGLVLGSVATQVIHLAETPVTLVK